MVYFPVEFHLFLIESDTLPAATFKNSIIALRLPRSQNITNTANILLTEHLPVGPGQLKCHFFAYWICRFYTLKKR